MMTMTFMKKERKERERERGSYVYLLADSRWPMIVRKKNVYLLFYEIVDYCNVHLYCNKYILRYFVRIYYYFSPFLSTSRGPEALLLPGVEVGRLGLFAHTVFWSGER